MPCLIRPGTHGTLRAWRRPVLTTLTALTAQSLGCTGGGRHTPSRNTFPNSSSESDQTGRGPNANATPALPTLYMHMQSLSSIRESRSRHPRHINNRRLLSSESNSHDSSPLISPHPRRTTRLRNGQRTATRFSFSSKAAARRIDGSLMETTSAWSDQIQPLPHRRTEAARA